MNLEKLRKKIKEIDTRIIENLVKRNEISIQIGKLKGKIGKEIYDPERESQLMDYYVKESEKLKINPEYVQNIFKIIISYSKIEQKK